MQAHEGISSLRCEHTSLDEKRLIGDIGGTNARFALLLPNGEISQFMTLACSDYPDIVTAIRHYLGESGETNVRRAALAIANPVASDWIEMTNHHWAFSIEQACAALGFDELIFKNDFTALAMSIPQLCATELHQVGGSTTSVTGSAMAVIGPGTGLGVSGLLRHGDHWVPLKVRVAMLP